MSLTKIMSLGLMGILLTSINNFNCGDYGGYEDMPRETRYYAPYQKMPKEACYNKQIVKSIGEMAQLVNNTLFVYAASNRIHQQRHGFYPAVSEGAGQFQATIPSDDIVPIVNGTLKGVYVGAGKRVSAWIYFKTSSTSGTMNLYLTVGTNEAVVEEIEDTSWGWVNVFVDIDAGSTINSLGSVTPIHLYAESVDADNTLYIETVSINELSSPDTPAWIDSTVANCKVGQPDYPFSASCSDLLRGNAAACYGFRTTKANLFNNFYAPKTGSGASPTVLGRYIIRKSEGATEVDFKAFLETLVTPPSATIRYTISLYKTVTNPFDTLEDSTTIDKTFSGLWLDWHSHTFSSLDSEEMEYMLLVDARLQSGSPLDVDYYSHNIFAADGLDSNIDHVLPDKAHVQPDDDIINEDILNIKNTLEHVWERKRQILVNTFHQTREIPSDSGFAEGTITSGLLYPSYGSKYIRCNAKLHMLSGEKGTLAYDNEQSPGPVTGMVTGASSGATARIGYVIDNGTDGYLYLRDINGTFLDDEQLNISGSHRADADGFLTDGFTGSKIYLRLALYHKGNNNDPDFSDTALVEQIVDLTDTVPTGGQFSVDLSLPIPEEYWNDFSETDNSPLEWFVQVSHDYGGNEAYVDYPRLDRIFVHEVQETELLTDVP